MNDIVSINAPSAPPPGGHYSHGSAWRDLVFVSGQLPVRRSGDHSLVTQDFASQARQAYTNLLAILLAAGSGCDDVLKVTIYLSEIAHWPLCNTIHAEFFGASRPARSIVPTGGLHFGYLIEIDAIARRRLLPDEKK